MLLLHCSEGGEELLYVVVARSLVVVVVVAHSLVVVFELLGERCKPNRMIDSE